MSYLSNRKAENRLATGIVVATIEAVLVLGVINALATDGTGRTPIERLTSIAVRTPPPPLPPPPSPDPQTNHGNTDTKATLVDVATNILTGESLYVVPTTGSTTIETGSGQIELPEIKPITPPSFTPRSPTARGKPGTWATPNDYPGRDLREGNQGVTGFRLTIGADGRVQNCEVTKSSGHPGLDTATCDKVRARARFDPATDDSGAKVTGTYTNAIRWEIPE
jgi:periplasmic protein TonB